MEKAVKCAQERCFKGCAYLKTSDITWADKTKSCYKDFCKNSDGKYTDGKICNDDSKANPIVFQSVENSGAEIQKDDLDTFGCVALSDSCGSGGFTKELVSGKTVLYIEKSLIPKSGFCN